MLEDLRKGRGTGMDGRVRNGLGITGALALAFAAVWIAKALFGEYVFSRELTATEVLTLGQMVVLALGLGSVVLLWIQSRDESKWRRLLSYHQYFSDCPPAPAREGMLGVMSDIPGHHLDDGGKPLQAAEVNLIVDDAAKRQKVVVYLDGFEQLSGAVLSGIVDAEYAYDHEGTRLLRIYHVFKPLILRIRQHSPRAYDQFECLAERWLEKRNADHKKARENPRRARAPG